VNAIGMLALTACIFAPLTVQAGQARQAAFDLGEAFIVAEWCARHGLSFSKADLDELLKRTLSANEALSKDDAQSVAAELLEKKAHLALVTPAACSEQRRQMQ
jgi:hypothetical protein